VGELDYRRVLDGFSDAIVTSDGARRITHLNSAAERLLGYSRDELLGNPLTVLMPSRIDGAQQEWVMGKAVRVPALHRDGHALDIELTLTRFQGASGEELFVASMRELRDRIELERQLTTQRHLLAGYRVMSVLTDCKTLEDAAPRLLPAIAEPLGWDVGLFWGPDEAAGVLRLRASWANPAMPANAFIAASRALTFKPGDGIPGRVWQSRHVQWSADVAADARYLRAQVAKENGLRGAFLFPVFSGETPDGVIEFLSRSAREPDPELFRTMETIGFQVGQFLDRIRSEELLRHERDNLRRLFEQVPAAIAVVRGPEYRYELSNAVNKEFAGGRELVGKPVREALPPAVSGLLLPLLEQVRQSGKPFIAEEFPIEIPQLEGVSRLRYLNGVYQPLWDDDGAVNGIFSFAYDVTEQVEARRRAEHAERSTALVADSIPQIVWSSNAAGQAEFFNRRWYEYSGQSREESQRADWASVCHPEDLPLLLEKWQTSFAAGLPFEGEVRMLRASDRTWRWHLTRSMPLKDEHGRVLRWIGSSTDIHDHKQAEELAQFFSGASALLGASLDYPLTLKNLAALIVPRLADWCSIYLQEEDDPVPRQLVVAHVDPQKVQLALELTRRYPQDPTATHGVLAVARGGAPEFHPEITDAMLAGYARDPEHLRLLRSLGSSSSMTVPIRSRDSSFGAISFVSSGRHFTQRDLRVARELADRAASAIENARLFKRAQEAVRVRDDFLSVASHELKTPLTPMLLQVQSLLRGARPGGKEPLSPKVTGKLDAMGRQVLRLERLVDRLLDISRITAGRLELELEEVDLAALAKEVASRFDAELAQTGSRLEFEAAGPMLGQWDRLRLDQIVTNLITNALKFGEGKPVELRLAHLEDAVRLTVRDHGIGISPADQARIFERFERAVSTTHFGGFGLGLWIVRQIVERLGGTIGVESTLGQGSTFTVRLPCGEVRK
jgi:PAS domain S-box-containing protein